MVSILPLGGNTAKVVAMPAMKMRNVTIFILKIEERVKKFLSLGKRFRRS
jgi:hypothetical protein